VRGEAAQPCVLIAFSHDERYFVRSTMPAGLHLCRLSPEGK